jgi:elongation factor Ts
MKIGVDQIKKLREETQASIADCRLVLETANGDYEKAIELLKAKGIERAEKKATRETAEGLVESYIHLNGKVGALVTVLCETDFVAKTEDFKHLVHEIAMQVAAMEPKDIDSLLKQDYIRDGSVTIEGLVKQTIGKLGENIRIKEFTRFEV